MTSVQPPVVPQDQPGVQNYPGVHNQPGVPVNVAGGQQMVFVNLKSTTVNNNLAEKSCLALGICQICIGASLIIVSIVAILMGAGLSYVGSGIWCSIFFIVTGSLGIGAAKSKGRCLIVSTLVCSIISAIASGGILLILNSVGMALEDIIDWSDHSIAERRAVDGVIIVLSVAECVVAIIQSVICYRAGGCCGQQNKSTVYYAAPTQPDFQQVILGPSGPMMMTPQGQAVMMPVAGQPMMMASAGQPMMMTSAGQPMMMTTMPQAGQATGYQPGYQPYTQPSAPYNQPSGYAVNQYPQGHECKQGQPM